MQFKKVHLIDKNGFYIEDEILEIPETVEEAECLNFPVAETGEIMLPTLRPDQIDVEIDHPYYKAFWDGNRWREGLSPDRVTEMEKPTHADWQGFINDLRESSVDEALEGTTKQRQISLFDFAIRQNPVQIDDVVTSFNAALSGVEGGLSEELVKELSAIIYKNRLPIQIESDGRMLKDEP